VSFATLVTGKIDHIKFCWYVVAQLSGSVLGALLTYIAFPGKNIKDVVPGRSQDVPLHQMFIMEVILSFILNYIIFACAFDKLEEKVDIEHAHLTIYKTGGSSKASFAPLAISMMCGALVLVGGTVSGSCFNPARSFGPALIAWQWKDQWVYWV
jgi:glycerol uptake facilitator-like aquaporin